MDDELNPVENDELDVVENGEVDPIDDENVFSLTDENGNASNFEFLDLIEYEGEQYVVLLPADSEEENDGSTVVILRVDDSEGEDEVYSAVEDQETVEAVFSIFKEKFSDEFTFDDEISSDEMNVTNPSTFSDMSDIYNDDNN